MVVQTNRPKFGYEPYEGIAKPKNLIKANGLIDQEHYSLYYISL